MQTAEATPPTETFQTESTSSIDPASNPADESCSQDLELESDLTLDGQRGSPRLVIRGNVLCTYAGPTAPQPAFTCGLADCQGWRAVPGVGSGLMQVRLEDAWVDVLRYSNVHADRFAALAKALEEARQQGPFRLPPEEDLNPARCGNCQMRLPTGTDHCPRCVAHGQIAKRLTALLRPQITGIVLLGLLTILGVGAELVPPKLQQYMVDQILAPGAAQVTATQLTAAQATWIGLGAIVIGLVISRVVLSVVGVFKGHLASRLGAGITCALRRQMVERLHQLAVAYYDRHQVGSLMSRVAHDSEAVHGLVHQITGGFLLQILQLIGVGIMLIVINPKLAMWTLIPVPFVFAGGYMFWRHVYPRYYRYWDSASKQSATLGGMLSGIRVVKAFAQEDRELTRFDQASSYLRQSRVNVEHAATNFSAWMQLVFSMGGLIVWYVGGQDVLSKEMTIGSLIAFLAYLAMFYSPLATLSNFTAWLTSFLTGCKRVFEVLDTPIAVQEPETPAALHAPQGSVAFERITFGYSPHLPVLKDVSVQIRPGEFVGVVGQSGSGKSTLVQLLARYYDVDSGQILVDGVNVKQIPSRDLRKIVGVVPQETYLFRGTIWENLAYGCPDLTIKQALEAAHAGGAHDFVLKTPLAYDTPLGENGAGLSGGEKQRLAIARALVYNPKILVLDEATSNIDVETEREIQAAIQQLAKGRTTLAIAHRLGTLRNADRILVFERGQLKEDGSHAQLLAKDGIYARLVRLQTQISTDPNVDQLMRRQLEQEQVPAAVNAKGGEKTLTSNCQDSNGKNGAQRQELLTQDATGGTSTPAVISQPPEEGAAGPPTVEPPAADKPRQLRWLSPLFCELAAGAQDTLQVVVRGAQGEETTHPGVFVVQTFPAKAPGKYLSLRYTDADGKDQEIGIIEDPQSWPAASQALLQRGYARRYYWPEIRSIDKITLHHGYLDFATMTDHGKAEFSVRWSQSQVQPFGEDGKLIHDTEDNRYVIREIAGLARKDRELFERFIYW